MRNDSRHIRLHRRHEHIDVPFSGVRLAVRNIIDDLRQSVSRRKGSVDSVGRKPGRIQLMEFVAQHTACLKSLFRADLENLIPRRIQDHRRMVVVVLHHMFDVALPAPRKIDRIVVAHLALIPHIHKLVHDIHAKPVARTKKRLRRRVVRRSDGVKSCFF